MTKADSLKSESAFFDHAVLGTGEKKARLGRRAESTSVKTWRRQERLYPNHWCAATLRVDLSRYYNVFPD
jgi:hypothetical protein